MAVRACVRACLRACVSVNVPQDKHSVCSDVGIANSPQDAIQSHSLSTQELYAFVNIHIADLMKAEMAPKRLNKM